MQFREVTYTQQLQYQRLIHGPEADISERSLPGLPGTAMREILKHSQHPQNLEQVLLTLRRPVNAVTRRRFAEVGGELVLIQKTTSSEPVIADLKIAHFGQVMDLPEGMLYPTKDHTTLFETWIRVEMLDALRLMIEENLIRSLLPEMQLKLITDMLDLTGDHQQPELIRLYAFAVAVAGLKRFHAARSAAIAAGFLAKATAFLAEVLDGPHGPDSIFSTDPFEQLKAITAAVEGLYLVAVTNKQGEYFLAGAGSGSGKDSNGLAAELDPAAIIAAAVAAGNTLASLDRSLEGLSQLQEHSAGPLLGKAVTKLWQLLQAREQFEYTPPASLLAAKAADNAEAGSSKAGADGQAEDGDEAEGEEESEEKKKLRAAAEEAVALAQVTFEENWQMFLKAVYDTELMPICVGVWLQLASALLQVLVHKQASDLQAALPSKEVLQQMAAFTKQSSVAIVGTILADMAAADAAGSGSTAAIMLLPGHDGLEYSAVAKSCCCCNKMEDKEVKLLRCGQCGCANYCSSTCQKTDWKLGHKGVCKELGEYRTAHCKGNSTTAAASS